MNLSVPQQGGHLIRRARCALTGHEWKSYAGFFNVRVNDGPWELREADGLLEVCARCDRRRGGFQLTASKPMTVDSVSITPHFR